MPKYLGTETEFGITVVGPSEMNPVLASSLVVSSYQPSSSRDQVKWDHTDEHPLRDARGYDDGAPAHDAPSDEELGLANTVLTNGARFYVDHAHPEYSTPECSNARDLVVWDKAGERILEVAAQRAASALPDGGRILIHKNNTDGKGAAYGTHENYLVSRQVPFPHLVKQLIPFFVSRPVYVGAGRLGNEFGLEDVTYQLTQRADFFEVEVGLETTLKRPIINTRDEPHADPDLYRRLHVINGDANLCEVATFLKVGTTALILSMIEDEAAPDPPLLAEPVRAFHQVSHDLSCRATIALDDGTEVTALEVQWHYLEAVKRYCKDLDLDPVQAEVLQRWEAVLTTAEEDPRKLAGQVDWATKLELLEQYRDRHELGWESDKLEMVSLQYHDVRRDKGLFNRLAARGKVERLVAESEIQRAMTDPPTDTRAYFRGRCLERFRDRIVAAGWDSLIFDVGREALQRVPMMDPGRGTQAHVGELFDTIESAQELLDHLTR
ncbi:MAG: proteasome accessory factor PafA2 [Actinobacteria bacterium]|nr:proteasome accessory factor PafA2 [Actinomycetota bacterium]